MACMATFEWQRHSEKNRRKKSTSPRTSRTELKWQWMAMVAMTRMSGGVLHMSEIWWSHSPKCIQVPESSDHVGPIHEGGTSEPSLVNGLLQSLGIRQLKPWHARNHVEKPWIQPWVSGWANWMSQGEPTETGRIDLSWMLWSWPWRQARFGAEVQGGDPNAVKNLWRCHRLSAWGKAEQARWCFRAIFPSAVVHSSTQESCIHALLWRPRDLRQLLCGSMLRRSKYEVLRDLLAKRGETSFWRRIRCHAAGRYNVMAPDTKCYLVYVSKKNPNRPVQKSAAQKIKRRKKRQKKSWTFLNRIFEDFWGDLSFNRCGATHAVCVAWSLSVTLVSLVA